MSPYKYKAGDVVVMSDGTKAVILRRLRLYQRLHYQIKYDKSGRTATILSSHVIALAV